MFPSCSPGVGSGPSAIPWGEVGWMPRELPSARCLKPPQPKSQVLPAQTMGFAAFPACGGAAPPRPPCQAVLLPNLEAGRWRWIETSPWVDLQLRAASTGLLRSISPALVSENSELEIPQDSSHLPRSQRGLEDEEVGPRKHGWERRRYLPTLAAPSASAQAPPAKPTAPAKEQNGILSGKTPLRLQL